jgi:hypothetical protein
MATRQPLQTLQASPDELIRVDISGGITGVKQTLKFMKAFAQEFCSSERIRGLSANLTSSLPQKDWDSEIAVLFYFVRDNIRYQLDTVNEERLYTPEKLLEVGAGDCDDKSTLLASMLMSIGHPCRFVAVGFEPLELTHVYVETQRPWRGSDWMPLDSTETNGPGYLRWDRTDEKCRYKVDM